MKRQRVLVGLFCLVAVRALAAGPLTQHPSVPVVARLKAHNAVLLVDAVTGAERTIFTFDQARGWLHDLTVAPSGRYVAVLATVRGTVAGHEYATLPRNELYVLSLDGKIAAGPELDVQRYVWCCGADRIALVAGTYREGGVEFTPQGVHLFDVQTKSRDSLPLPREAHRLEWAAFDSALYVGVLGPPDQPRVWRYQPSTHAVEATPYRDLQFSPSGQYYLYWGPSAGGADPRGWRIVERATSHEIPPPRSGIGAIVGWAFGAGDRLLLAAPTSACPTRVAPPQPSICRVEVDRYTVFDLQSRKSVRTIAGRMEPGVATSSRDVVAVMRDGALRVVADTSP